MRKRGKGRGAGKGGSEERRRRKRRLLPPPSSSLKVGEGEQEAGRREESLSTHIFLVAASPSSLPARLVGSLPGETETKRPKSHPSLPPMPTARSRRRRQTYNAFVRKGIRLHFDWEEVGGSHPPPSSAVSKDTKGPSLPCTRPFRHARTREPPLLPIFFSFPFPAASVPPPPIHPSLLSTSSFPFSGHQDRLQSSFRSCHRTRLPLSPSPFGVSRLSPKFSAPPKG